MDREFRMTDNKPMDDKQMAVIYLVSGRKQGWAIDLPDGWVETHFDRSDYIDAGTYEKQIKELTNEDKEILAEHGEIPEGWF